MSGGADGAVGSVAHVYARSTITLMEPAVGMDAVGPCVIVDIKGMLGRLIKITPSRPMLQEPTQQSLTFE